MPKKIVFLTNQLSVRGTEVALFDYAYFNQELLNNHSVVAYKKNSSENDLGVIKKFSNHFELLPYETLSDLERNSRFASCDLMYVIKSGEIDDLISNSLPTMVHAVFPQHSTMAHGASYAFVSQWLSDVCSNGVIPAVPHMVTLPSIDECLREELSIPQSATVFGGYGGANSFDLAFAQKAVSDMVLKRSDVYFLFMNIVKFVDHPRIIFLPGTADLDHKVRFINTCDAMLHARKLGESFGLACAEFSVKNKPIFTYSKSMQRHHIDVLGSKAILYSGYQSLFNQLLGFDRVKSAQLDWDCYSSQFSPSRVMNLFDKHLIQTALTNGPVSRPHFKLGWQDRFACGMRDWQLRFIKLSRYWAR